MSEAYSALNDSKDKNDEIKELLERFFVVSDLELYPLLYKKKDSRMNEYAVPVIIPITLNFSDYYKDKSVKIKFSDLPVVSPYNLYVDDEIEKASNHLMLCKDEEWSELINSEIIGNEDAVTEEGEIKNENRWNDVIDFILKHAENPYLIEDTLEKQNFISISKQEDQITILRDSYASFIRYVKSRKENDVLEFGLLEDYIKKPDKPDAEKELKESTNYEKLLTSLKNENIPSFTGQLKFHGKPGSMFTLNIEQKIFLHCLKKQDDKITALNGPPGTGKTTMLQSVAATKIVDAVLKDEETPLFFGASFTNQAKNNIIGGFKIEEIENEEAEAFMGNATKRWIPGIGGKTIDYGCVTKGDEKSKKDGLWDLNEIEETTLGKEWLKDAEEYYLENFNKTKCVSFTDELKIFGSFSTFEIKTEKNTDIRTAVETLKASVKNLYSDYLLRLERKKYNVLNLKRLKRDAAVKEEEIKELKKSLKSLEDEESKYEEIENNKNEFVKFWSDYIEKYPFIKKILPFLQSELALRIAYKESTDKYPGLKEFIKSEPKKYKIKFIKDNIVEILNDDSIEKIKNEVKAKKDAVKGLVQSKTADLDELRGTVGESEQIITKTDGALDFLLKDEISEKDFNYAYAYLGAIIDNNLKYALFNLSMRANEGKFIIEAQKTLSDDCLKENNTFKKSLDGNAKKFRLFSLITPCFVSTMHSIYKNLSYYKASEGNIEYTMPKFIDYLLVDEAGQISPEIGALSFLLAKKAIVVGDTYQIPPVYSITPHMDYGLYKYKVKSESGMTEKEFESLPFNCHEHGGSVMKIAQNNSNFWEFPELERGLYVIEHRRCPKEIIDFSNELMYHGRLRCPDDWGFENVVKEKIFEKQAPWNFIEINGECRTQNRSRVNEAEAEAVTEWIINNLQFLNPADENVAVITPFKAQSVTIQNKLKNRIENGGKIVVGTVHALQGAEQKIILFSMTYDKESAGKTLFIDKYKNIINVGVSRTKQSFYVFGEKELFLKAQNGSATRLLGKYLNIIQ